MQRSVILQACMSMNACRLTGGLVTVQDIQPVGEHFQHFALKEKQSWSNNYVIM